MKKIAIISTSYFPNIWNSQGRSTFATAYGLAKKGYDVSVFTYTNKETCKKQDGQVMVYYIGGVSDPSVSAMPFNDIAIWNERMLPLLLCEKFDTIILNNWHGFEAAKKYSSAKIVSMIPFLYTFTGWLKPLGFALEQEIKVREADCILESDMLISHTFQFGRRLSDYSNREVTVIPNCYLDFSNASTASKVTVIKNQICSVGRVNREKSIERIIRVLPDIQEATLVVVAPESSQTYFNSLIRLAKKMDVENRITFLGWMNTKDTRDLYKSSSMAIVPSQFEPYGFGAIDPMSLEVPVIASEWSCLEEYIGTKETIFNSLDNLKEMICKQLLISSKDKDAMVTHNKKRITEEFSEEAITNLIEQVI